MNQIHFPLDDVATLKIGEREFGGIARATHSHQIVFSINNGRVQPGEIQNGAQGWLEVGVKGKASVTVTSRDGPSVYLSAQLGAT